MYYDLYINVMLRPSPTMSTMPLSLNNPEDSWPDQQIHELVQKTFDKRPCWYQIQVVKVLYAGRDVLGIAPTGAGKTLSFWIAQLMASTDK